MDKRRAILERVRATHLPAHELPSLQQAWVQYDDPYRQFAETLASVGGVAVELGSRDQVAPWLTEKDFFQRAQRVVCTVEGVSAGNVDLNSVTPHQLADVDVVIATGEIAVAENGAVWVSDRNIPHRAALFIAQHAVLVVARSALVNNLHEAYERLQFAGPGFGAFISGPSKTADIEQSLVIGAHGPKSMHVIVIG